MHLDWNSLKIESLNERNKIWFKKAKKLIDENNNYLKACAGCLRSSDDSITVFTAQDEIELEKLIKSVYANLKMFGINPSKKK